MMCVSQNDSSSRVNVFFRSLVTRALRCVESHEHRVSATAADLSWLSNGCSLCLVPCLPSISFCFTTLSPLSSSLCPYSLVLSSYFLHGFLFLSPPALSTSLFLPFLPFRLVPSLLLLPLSSPSNLISLRPFILLLLCPPTLYPISPFSCLPSLDTILVQAGPPHFHLVSLP